MSDIQKVLEAMEKRIHDGYLTEDMCYGLRMALNGIPDQYHMNAFKALIEREETKE